MQKKLKHFLRADIKHLKTAVGDGSFISLFLSHKNVRIVVLFRILNYYFYYRKKTVFSRILHKPLYWYYCIMTSRYCIDLPIDTRIGEGFKLNHSYGIVINSAAVIGENVYIGHNVTIGSNGITNVPKIGNFVTVFTGSIIVGNVEIGDRVVIGAGSLVIKSIPPDSVVGGSICKILRSI